jgi:EmrB/QacA subfamily drug resistance transporter
MPRRSEVHPVLTDEPRRRSDPRGGQRAEPPAEPAPGAAPALDARWGLPLVMVIVGMFMAVLDSSIVNVAVPTIQKDFGAANDDIQWIATAYNLCLGVVVPATAWLGDRVGLRRLYLVALLSFSAASALCGMAWDLDSMIAFRVLQAVPGGMLPVTCLTIVYKIVPPARIGTAMGLYGLGIVVAPAIGPTMGGYLVEYTNWRLIFDINVPIGLAGALGAFLVLPAFAKGPRRQFDLPGFLTIAAGLFALLLALSEGQDWGWTGYRVLMLFVAGTLLLALFVVIELEAAVPLLDVRVFRHWPFVNSLVLISMLFLGLFAVLYYVPLFLQEGQQMRALDAGLLMMPQALVMLVMMPLVGRLYDRVGPRLLASCGLAISGVGTLLMCGINADMTRSEIVWWMMVRALGVGISMMPIMTFGISALPPNLLGVGSAYSTLGQRVSGALGLALLTALATAQQAQLVAAKGALLPATLARTDPRVTGMLEHGPVGLYPLLQRTQVQAMAQAYSNMFLLLGVASLVSAGLALFLRAAPSRAGSEPVETG